MICQICNKDCQSLGSHLKYSHKDISIKNYYDRFICKADEGICPVCNKATTFRGLTKGYLKYCSSTCSNSDKTVILKKKASTKEHFGNENYRNTEKARETRLNLYGQFNSEECIAKIKATKQGKTVEEINDATEKSRITREAKYNQWRAPDTTDKIAFTKLQKYGISTYNNRMQAVDTCLKKYGVSHPSKLFLLEFLKNNNTAELIDDSGELVTIKCKNCNSICEISRCNLLTRPNDTLCNVCKPYPDKYNGKSIEEQTFTMYIKDVYKGKVIENDRTILNGKELDIYLPDKKLAFEFDGLYWHSDEFKTANYHLNKTDECEKQNIQLIHIFEDEWLNKRDIVKSRINGLLGLNERIFARKCIVKQVETKAANKFLENNHIQGACSAKYKIGLYYNDELVSLMTFGKSRFADEFELIRFCNKLNTNVIGGASKLFKHFIKMHSEIKTIISYADRRWSVGNLYEKIGFAKQAITKPNYFYVKNFLRENRMKYQKHKLVAAGYDNDKTESEIMNDLGYRKIYDCGTIKYEAINC